jgi:hypothetical protein
MLEYPFRIKGDFCLQQEKSIADTALYIYRAYRRKDLALERAKERQCPVVEKSVKKKEILFAKWDEKWEIFFLVKEGAML